MAMSEEEKDALTNQEAAEGAADAKKPASKLKGLSKKKKILAGVLALIVVVGVGFWSWHETPEFCVSICHKPMDSKYLDTLYANPYEKAVDKWGNDVEYAGAMLASLHGNMGKHRRSAGRWRSCGLPRSAGRLPRCRQRRRRGR